VIATDYGGNVDFCRGPLSHPVRYTSVPIPYGAYPSADGHSWAEPDLQHAVALMRQVAATRHQAGDRIQPVDSYREVFSARSAGQRYRQRLARIWSQRQTLYPLLQQRQVALIREAASSQP
jgi:hypothetical protein